MRVEAEKLGYSYNTKITRPENPYFSFSRKNWDFTIRVQADTFLENCYIGYAVSDENKAKDAIVRQPLTKDFQKTTARFPYGRKQFEKAFACWNSYETFNTMDSGEYIPHILQEVKALEELLKSKQIIK